MGPNIPFYQYDSHSYGCISFSKGIVPDLHHCASLLGMLPALLDLAAAGPVQLLGSPVPQGQAQHQLSNHRVAHLLQTVSSALRALCSLTH